jgi:hypothetical protein
MYFNRFIKASDFIQTNRRWQTFFKKHSLTDMAIREVLAIKPKLAGRFYHIRKITPRCLKKIIH